MPITELAVVSLKQDEVTREAFIKNIFPTLVSLVDGQKGMRFRTEGMMLSLNGLDVSSEFRPVLGIGWDAVSDFQAVVAGPGFEVFKTGVTALATKPPFPELYNTDILPLAVYGSALTEVFKIKVGDDDGKLSSAEEGWKKFVRAIGDVESLCGISVNLEERTFLGVVGWESKQVRDKALERQGIEEAKANLGELESFVVEFGGFRG